MATTAPLYKTLLAQEDAGYHKNALKTCEKIRRRDEGDALAQRTQLQLLLALDSFKTAAKLASDFEQAAAGPSFALEKAYALYKLGREADAAKALEGAVSQETAAAAIDERGLLVIQAQIAYRRGNYEGARAIYEELVATVDPDSLEHADLLTNLHSCEARVEFKARVPDELAQLSQRALPPVEVLESTPCAPLVHSHKAFRSAKPAAATAAVSAEASTSKTTSTAAGKTGKPPKRLPKDYDPSKTPDPERWLPKRERASYAAEFVRQKESRRAAGKRPGKQVGKGKAGAAEQTQGAADDDWDGEGGGDTPQQAAQRAGAQKKAGGANSKKKKGKK